MAEDRRADDVAAGRFGVLGRSHPAAVLEQHDLEAGGGDASAAERIAHRVAAVDRELNFLRRAGVLPGKELERLLGDSYVRFLAAHRFSAREQRDPALVEEVGIEVGLNAAPRLGPLEVDIESRATFDSDPEGRVVGAWIGIEIHALGHVGEHRHKRRRAGRRLAERRRLPGGDLAARVDQVAVAGRGEVGGSALRHIPRRDADRALLEEGLREVDDIVDDRPRAGGVQAPDVVGERRQAGEGGGEGERGAGGEVVDDLGHRPALVAAGGFRVVQHVHRPGRAAGVAGAGQVAAGDVPRGARRRRGVAVERVGEDADRDPGAVEVEGGADGGGAELAVPLRGRGAGARGRRRERTRGRDERGEHLGDAADPGDGGDARQVGRPDRRRHRLVAAADVDDPRPRGPQVVDTGGGAPLEADVDEDAVPLAQQAARPPPREAERRRLPGRRRGAQRRPRQLGEPRRELAVGWPRGGRRRARQQRDRQEESGGGQPTRPEARAFPRSHHRSRYRLHVVPPQHARAANGAGPAALPPRFAGPPRRQPSGSGRSRVAGRVRSAGRRSLLRSRRSVGLGVRQSRA